MTNALQTLRELLNEELSYFTDSDLHLIPDDIFNPSLAKQWLIRLLSNAPDDMTILAEYIDMPPKRFSHVLSTYLLGSAIRRKLELNFNMLPRIFPIHVRGDAFGFFWAVVCLCHDLGCKYEDANNKSGIIDLSLMESSGGRKKLFKITHDMLAFEPEDIDQLTPEFTEAERQWVKTSICLVKKYERFRREQFKLIDHGVAGGLILYDLLLKLAHKNPKIEQQFRGQTTATRPVLGELSANSSQRRFDACALLIACTVARHNVWTTCDPDKIPVYKHYQLAELCFSKGMFPENRIEFQKGQEELLFFLGMLDTIDPVKGLYLRDDIQSVRYQEVLDRVWIMVNLGDGIAGYQSVCVQIDNEKKDGSELFRNQLLNKYFVGWRAISEWLHTSPSVCEDERGTCYFPVRPDRKWPEGITEAEIRALCLYEGDSDGSRAEAFWRTPNAYQTINLLMMNGLDGERVRICIEKQNPHGLYIEHWRTTLKVLCDIYRAQQKCHNMSLPVTCYRVERKENLKLMCHQRETISYFSTSKDRYLKDLASQKEQLILLVVTAKTGIPFFDYAAILGRDYLYSSEQEVLFPPFLSVSLKKLKLEEGRTYPCDRNGNPPKALYSVTLSATKWRKRFLCKSKGELIKLLDKYNETAARVLRGIRNQRSIKNIRRKDLKVYKKWKKCFQDLVFLSLQELSSSVDI